MNLLQGTGRYFKTLAGNYTPSVDNPDLVYYDVIPDSSPVAYKPRPEGSGFERTLAQTAKFHADHPLTFAAYPAALVANAVVGNPLGGTLDAITGGMTNLKQDDMPSMQSVPKATRLPELSQSFSLQELDAAVPAMTADDLKRQVDYYRKRIRTDVETLKALERQNYANQTAI
jgi:hypothetical protein